MRTRSLTILAAALAAVHLARADEPAQPPAPPPVPPIAPPPPAPPPEPERAKPPVVVLEPSFRLPKEVGGKEVSHTPAVAFTRDGSRLTTATSAGEIVVFDAKRREIARRVSIGDAPIAALAMDPEGRTLVVALADGSVRTIDQETAKPRAALGEKHPAGAASVMAVSADGQRVAIARGRAVEVRSLADLTLVATKVAHGAEVTGLAFSPSGDALATVSRDGKLKILTVPALEEKLTVEKGSPLYAVACSPDGKKVAFGGEERILYELTLEPRAERIVAQGQPYWITAAGYSPDGKVIAIGDESCDIWLFDVEKSERLFHSKHHVECWLSTVAWAPDNETFLFGCRPNAHAGKPAIHAQNVVLEAAAAEEVQAAASLRAREEAALLAAYEREECAEVRSRIRELLAKRASLLAGARPGDGALDRVTGEWEKQVVIAGTPEPAGAPAPQVASDVGAIVVNEQVLQAPMELDPSRQPQEQLGYAAERAIPIVDEAKRRELAEIEKALAAARADLAAIPGLKEALAKAEAAGHQHEESHRKACAELQQTFNLNQWRLKK